MAFLARDRIRPKAPEMNSRPPCERDARERQHRDHVDADAAKMPNGRLAQELRGPWRE